MPTSPDHLKRADWVVTKIQSLLRQVDVQSKQIKMYEDSLEDSNMQRDLLYNTLCEIRMRDPETELSVFKSTWPTSKKQTAVEYHSKDGYECLPKNWVSTPDTRKFLKAAEDAWVANKPQQALIELDQVIKKGVSEKAHVNALLLRSCIMRGAEELKQALGFATLAFRLAKSHGFYPLCGKSQYFRSLCFYEMEEIEDAKWSLWFAHGVRGYEDHIHMLHALLEEASEKKKDIESKGKPLAGSNTSDSGHSFTLNDESFPVVGGLVLGQFGQTGEGSSSRKSSKIHNTIIVEALFDCCQRCPVHCPNLAQERQAEEVEEQAEGGEEEEGREEEEEGEGKEREAKEQTQVSVNGFDGVNDDTETSPQSEAKRSDHEETPEVRVHSPTPPDSPKQDVEMVDVDMEAPAEQGELQINLPQSSYLQIPRMIQSDHPNKDLVQNQEPQSSGQADQPDQHSPPELKGADHWAAENLSYLDPVRSVENQYGVAEDPSSPNEDHYGYLYRHKAKPKSRKSTK